MSYKPEVLVDNKWYDNGLAFETKQEAEDYAKDLFMRWFSTSDHRAVESEQPVNYTFINGTLEAVS